MKFIDENICCKWNTVLNDLLVCDSVDIVYNSNLPSFDRASHLIPSRDVSA